MLSKSNYVIIIPTIIHPAKVKELNFYYYRIYPIFISNFKPLKPMKTIKITILFSILSLIVSDILAQDKIIKRTGDTLNVKIVTSTPDMVEFTYPNEQVVNSEYKNSLVKIIYASGRVEDCAGEKKLAVVNGVKDWEKVEITSNPDDVKGLTKLGEVIGKSGWGGSGAQGLGDKNARKDLKKNAAKLNASIVLLQEKADTWGVKLVGVAYK